MSTVSLNHSVSAGLFALLLLLLRSQGRADQDHAVSTNKQEGDAALLGLQQQQQQRGDKAEPGESIGWKRSTDGN
jgi:hypothetical protein